jgi:hypothetical protein
MIEQASEAIVFYFLSSLPLPPSTSVVVGSETFSRIWIRVIPDQDLYLSGSGSEQLRTLNGFLSKTTVIKFDNFSTKMLMLKYKFLFDTKKSLKSLYLIIICNLLHTLTRREYKGKIHVKNISKNSGRIRNQLKNPDPDMDPKKSFRIHNTVIHHGSVCLLPVIFLFSLL